MSFYGSSFSFDGVSCEEYGLMLYDFDNTTQGNSKFADIEVYEDRVYQRPRSFFYGASYKDPLEFKLVFGANEYAAAQNEPIDRQDMEVIGSWLTGHDAYKWMSIDQPDMAGIRYRCMITDLEVLEVGFDKWAFICTVHCDSPYAYTLPMEYSYTLSGTTNIVLHSRSSVNTPYCPQIAVTLTSGGNFSIMNHTLNDLTTTLSEVPASAGQILIDGERGIVTCDAGLNLYPNFNFTFPKLKRGDNSLTITGTGNIKFTCEFPVNVGG